MKKIIYFFLFIFLGFVLNSCPNYDEGMDPCYCPYTRPSNDLSEIIILKNNDTIEIIKEFDYVIAYYDDCLSASLTHVEINTYDFNDDDFGYYLLFSFKGYKTGDTGDYDSSIVFLCFKQPYPHYDKCYSSDKSQIRITKYEDVWGLVEGNFADNLIPNDTTYKKVGLVEDNLIYGKDSISDTIFVSCKFSALRWCDGGCTEW
jgi:hypothetical protein